MLIRETSQKTGLTKKAIEYYCEQGLITPAVLENGYREFSVQDIEKLQKISALRKLGLNVNDIQSVLADTSGETMQQLSARLELTLQAEQAKQDILRKLCAGASYTQIQNALETIEKRMAVAQRILHAFPSYYGRFICLHFARFLNEPIVSDRQEAAYQRMIRFLDNVPALTFSEDLQEYLQEITQHIGNEQIEEIQKSTRELLKNAEKYLTDHQQTLAQYREFQQSDAFRHSPAYRIQQQLKTFLNASGYYEEFIPAMKELSPSYAAYYQQLEEANEKFLSLYPDAGVQDV